MDSRLHPVPMALQRDFEDDPLSVRAVRGFIADALHGHPRLDDVALVASELTTNVIQHAHTAFTVRLDANDDRLRLEISDGSSIIPAVEQLSESKRGLRVVEGVSEQWGVELTKTGKTVWVEFRATT